MNKIPLNNCDYNHEIKGFIYDNIFYKKIPLDTKYDYFCGENGRIFCGFKELKGWAHESYGKEEKGIYYKRYGLYVKEGNGFKRKFFYGQRLVGMTYHNLLDSPDLIMRHLSDDTFNNHKDFVKPGTAYDNNVTDRKRQGTYYNRGGKCKK